MGKQAMADIGLLIEIRDRYGLTEEDIADRLSRTPGCVQSWFQKNEYPKTVEPFAKRLKAELDRGETVPQPVREAPPEPVRTPAPTLTRALVLGDPENMATVKLVADTVGAKFIELRNPAQS